MKSLDKKEKSDCSASDDSPPQRPKRNTCQKGVGVTNGLLWREETDLKKALYASLQENKRRNWDEDGEENPDDNDEEEEQNVPAAKMVENGVEESPKKAKVHAQRKFAQGSTPSSPAITPQKVPAPNSTTQLLPNKRPKTEDFLTFLCLRGTQILPPSLDFLNNCSKSDSSSDCRSLSPDLNEYTGKDSTTKNGEIREKIKHDMVENGLPRKAGACRASSKTSPPVKKLNFTNSKLNKVALSSKKKKTPVENGGISHSKSLSKAKESALNALKEKYKKQRLAADKKKLLPAKSANSSASSKKVTVAKKSQSSAKTPVTSKTIPPAKHAKINAAIIQKSNLSKMEKKLAVEKRKSLRSSDTSRPKRLATLKKKTPWIRRAKLVPPIVDVESDSSEPEVITLSPDKKTSPPTNKREIKQSDNVRDRLRSKHASPKMKNRLTPRQVLLRKHMHNRLKNKKSILNVKNIRSRTIVKRTGKQAVLKNIKKNLAIKSSMSLRKDLQNKRVTRSAKHQIEEMLWSNPEKRTRVQNQKPTVISKSEKKKLSNESPSAIPKRLKLAPNKEIKEKESSRTTPLRRDVKEKETLKSTPPSKDVKETSKVTYSNKDVKESKIMHPNRDAKEKEASKIAHFNKDIKEKESLKTVQAGRDVKELSKAVHPNKDLKDKESSKVAQSHKDIKEKEMLKIVHANKDVKQKDISKVTYSNKDIRGKEAIKLTHSCKDNKEKKVTKATHSNKDIKKKETKAVHFNKDIKEKDATKVTHSNKEAERVIHSNKDDQETGNGINPNKEVSKVTPTNKDVKEKEMAKVVHPNREIKETIIVIHPNREIKETATVLHPNREIKETIKVIHPNREIKEMAKVIHPNRENKETAKVIHNNREIKETAKIMHPNREIKETAKLIPLHKDTKEKEQTKILKNSKESLKRKSHSTSTDKFGEQNMTLKMSSDPINPAKILRRSLSRDEKPNLSSSSKAACHQKPGFSGITNETKVHKLSSQNESNKESKIPSNTSLKRDSPAVPSTYQLCSLASKALDNINSASISMNEQLSSMNVKVNLERDAFNKLDFKDKNDISKAQSSNLLGNDKNVQNNLNLLEPEKTGNKDISNLIKLNFNVEEPTGNVNCDPCFSGSSPNIKDKNINKVKDTKDDSVKEINFSQEHKVVKKNHDKKSSKKSSKEEKLKFKEKSTKKSDKSEFKFPKKHKERRLSKDSDIKKNSHKKELDKSKIDNKACDVKKYSAKSSSEKKSKLEKSHSDSYSSKNSEKSHKKDAREKSPSKYVKQCNDESKPSPTKKGLNNADMKKINSEIFTIQGSSCTILSIDVDKKEKYDIQQPSTSKDQPRNIINNSGNVSARETDDDSDYDLTLDQIIKLNAVKSTEKHGSVPTTPVKQDISNIKNSQESNKDGKPKKESDKSKKDSESVKHKKDKDSSKSKSHDKDQRTPKKDDKSSRKDSEKSLAKLLRKEREKDKMKSSKKEEKNKHKKDSNGFKSSKKDIDKEKDGMKLLKNESISNLSILGESSSEHSEGKKEKKKERSSSCDDTKSPKKKKKHNEFKDIEKIKNLISKSNLLNEISGFKEFKRRSSSDKSELKKSKKRKKLALLKEKKLSKKLSSKLLRKYSKKKGLKSKKNKLKKKELKEMKIADLESKILSKVKKQKHKMKSDHHDKMDKSKTTETSTMSVTTSKTVNITSTCETAQIFAKVNESHCVSYSNTASDINISNSQTCTSGTSTVPTYIIESVPEIIHPIETVATPIPQPLAATSEQYMFGGTNELQGIVTSDFTGVFDETFPSGAILLATRDSLSQVPVHFIQDISVPKTMADAATNTGEDELEQVLETESEVAKSDEMSVGTQTMTPACSPSPTLPTVEIQPLVLPQVMDSLKKDIVKNVTNNPVPTVSSIAVSEKAIPSKVTPSKLVASNVISGIASTSSPTKPKRRSSFVKKSKTQSIVLPKGQPFPIDSAKLVTAPVYYPTPEEFKDPLEYIFKIQEEAAQFGICKIVPPSSFKPECKVNDDMRFTAHNQYLHKMLNRWGHNVQHTACIKKHLKSQKVKLEQAPLIGGIELDISRFYHTVQQYGGLQQVIEKKKWQRVADALHVPKTAQDRVTKLYDAYCRYLVSFATLPTEEKEKLREEVVTDHEKRIKIRNSGKELEKEEEEFDDEENTDCVSKGRSMTLSNFFRIARNTMTMWFKNAPSPDEVEHEYWKVVTESQQHVVVHAGNIDSSVYQSGFACNRNSPFAKHPWNLKILTNNSSSILRCMGPVSGVTIPTLHVGMLFTTGCWYRDPHSLPWIEYLHTGASKIWYSIPAKACENFRESMKKIMPEYCTNNPIWLPSDTAMVPPDLLVKHGASLSRTIQSSGQFVVIFPESFTSTICCGYCVSESVYFAPTSWLDLAVKAFKDIQSSCEPPAFSLERLLLCIANDPKTQPETLQKILPLIQNIRMKEGNLRFQLSELGLKQFERLPQLDAKDKKKKSRVEDVTEQECEVCRTHCYVSMVVYTQEETIYCLPHALEHIPKKNLKLSKLIYTYDENELKELEKRVVELISTHQAKLNAKKKSPKKKLTPAPEK